MSSPPGRTNYTSSGNSKDYDKHRLPSPDNDQELDDGGVGADIVAAGSHHQQEPPPVGDYMIVRCRTRGLVDSHLEVNTACTTTASAMMMMSREPIMSYQADSGPKSDHDMPPTTTRTADGDTTTTTTTKPNGKSRSHRPDVPNYQCPKSLAGTTTHDHNDSAGVALAAREVGGAALMNESSGNRKTKKSSFFVYPRHDSAGPAANYVAEADEATIPVVDAAFAPPEGGGELDLRAERLRVAEQRAVDAEAGRLAAERRLADETRSLWERLTSLSKRQWLGIGLATFGLMVIVVSVTFAVCGSDVCRNKRKTTTTTTTTTSRPPATSSHPPMLSARAQFIVDYINNITLTGRTLTYPDYNTPEGRALAWLIDTDDEINDKVGDDNYQNETSTSTETALTADKVSLRQRYALGTLWFQTPDHFDETYLRTNDTWGTALDECEWFGVVCYRTGAVATLQLEGLVQGEIPADLALLTDLAWLDLSLSKGLVGTIPSSLGTMTNLLALFVIASALTGTIPSSLASLSSLNILTLVNNKLDGTIPSELGACTVLTVLALNGNDLKGTIPTELGALTKLSGLGLSENQLTGTTPPTLAALTDLTLLNLHGNTLTGTIPLQLGELTALTELLLYNNTLTGTIPSQLGALTALTRLGLSNNALTGTIPSQLSSLTALSALYLWENALTGTIPPQLGGLTVLTDLQLCINTLSGTIPSQVGSLTALSTLYLWGNALTGTIPSQLGDLTELLKLDLEGNRLTGTVPSQLTALATLTELHLFNNRLNGSLPFCNNRNNSNSDNIIDHNMTTFDYLTADCNEVACPCCTHCCPAGGWDGIPVIPADWSNQCD
jgi:Leucine-rich repeat (LRR) protein